jgi:hypothetical protein
LKNNSVRKLQARPNNLDDILEMWTERLLEARKEIDEKVRKSMRVLRQKLYANDVKRTFNWFVKDSSLNGK